MNLSILRTRLLIIMILSIVVSFIILGIYSADVKCEDSYLVAKNEEMLTVRKDAKYINSFFESKMDILKSCLNKISLEEDIDLSNKNLLNTFKMTKEAGDFTDVYIGLEENGYLLSIGLGIFTPEKDNFDARTRPWYKDAVKNNNGGGVSAPYIDTISKKLVVSIYAPLRINGQIVGVIGSDIFLDTIVNTVLNTKLKNTGYAYLVDKNGKILIHKDKKLLNKEDSLFKNMKTGEKTILFKEVEGNNGENVLATYSLLPMTNWYLVTRLDKSEIIDELISDITTLVLIYIVLLIVILIVLYLMLQKILSPLSSIEDTINFFFRYLKGEEKEIKSLDKKDSNPIVELLYNEMKLVEKGLIEDKALIEEVKSVVDHVNDGKLDIQVKKSTSNKVLNELKDILNEMIKTINKNVNSDINPILDVLEQYSKLDFRNEIKNPNGKVSKGLNTLNELITTMLKENKEKGLVLNDKAKLLLDNVDILNKSSNDTAASLEETAAAVEEITSSVSNNTNSINQVSEHSKDVVKAIEEGQELANSTVAAMDEINEQTQSIAEAITVIDQIAFQTNILSLNAAVEAATAGEAGKGFAVVAQEVRNLASRSAEAAKEIKELVENASSKTSQGKQIADNMIEGYSKLNEDILKTTEVINDIAQSSKEQRISIEQINDVVNKLDQQTQKNASVAAHTQDIAMDTSNIASEILNDVNNKKFRE